MRAIRAQIDDFGGTPRCSLIGAKKTSPDRAALYNSALVRYLDFNDSYLAKGETCHPSDNLGAVLAASEYANCSGKDLIAALAVAYQVRCRLSDVAPVRAKGFDHTVQGAYALAAGSSRALGLGQEQTTNAIAICGTAFNALRVTRTILKRYNAEIHAQSTLEGVLKLREEEGFSASQLDRVEVETFDVAYNIIGGGEEGITESVNVWRTDVPAKIVDALGLEKVMFEAADPTVFAWYVKNYGPTVNLFVDHSQIVQLECLRSGIWGTASLWGRVITANR